MQNRIQTKRWLPSKCGNPVRVTPQTLLRTSNLVCSCTRFELKSLSQKLCSAEEATFENSETDSQVLCNFYLVISHHICDTVLPFFCIINAYKVVSPSLQ